MDWDEGCSYSWAVICKNTRFHHRQNQFVGHKILLGESDSCAAQPALPSRFPVRCDECGKISCYKYSDVVRFQVEIPESFVPHPLFRQSSHASPNREDNPAGQEEAWKPCRLGIFKAFLALVRLTFTQPASHKQRS
jgi:hypothetical protein